jgi:hypothetical protein
VTIRSRPLGLGQHPVDKPVPKSAWVKDRKLVLPTSGPRAGVPSERLVLVPGNELGWPAVAGLEEIVVVPVADE